MKTAERAEARRLRHEGHSVRDIERLLGVSRSSVSRWVRDIELTRTSREVLRLSARSNRGASRSAHFRAKRRAYQDEGRAAARRGDPLHAAGCMLYWAEGAKHPNAAKLSNSDPEVLRFFARFLRTCFHVPDGKMRVWCNLFADHVDRQHEIEGFWLDVLGLPQACLTKSTVNVYSKYSKRTRINALPYGTCRLSVHSTAIVQHIYGATQEYAGFNRPEWLG
jgi:hypothetical protein